MAFTADTNRSKTADARRHSEGAARTSLRCGGLRCDSGARVSDAVVTAEAADLGLSGNKKKFEPMQIAGTTTYGGFFDLPGFDLYTVKLTVERSGAGPAVLQFKYDHRR
jgi:hypothetical protein